MIAVTIRTTDAARARQLLAAPGKGAGLIELRLDDLDDAGFAWDPTASALPLLVTCRPGTAPGVDTEGESARLERLLAWLDRGAWRADVEIEALPELLRRGAPLERLVVSIHDHEPGSARLERHLERLLAVPRAATLKLAFTPASQSDVLLGRAAQQRLAREHRVAAIVPMGEIGIPGRLLALSWGACWTYAAPDGEPPAASGQLPLTTMETVYDVRSLKASTRLTGLLGWPLADSLSPFMHNAACRALGLDARYLLFPDPDPGQSRAVLEAYALLGAGVTRPHKEQAVTWANRLTPAAAAIGAVNTLTRVDGIWQGDNTDARAAGDALEAGLTPGSTLAGRRLGVLGGGGAARAVAWEGRRRGARVTLHTRDPARGRAAAADLEVQWAPLDAWRAGPEDVTVNATPVGSGRGSEALPIPVASLGGGFVLDLVTVPATSGLVLAARRRGLLAAGGIGMLARQGEAQFRQWHGVAPPTGLFAAAARDAATIIAPP